MGQFYSRPDERVENVDLSFMTYRYPPKSGNYFSSHFIMGDQTFAGTQPECFLFGDNNDLNFLYPRPVAFPYPETHKSEPSKMLRSLVNLRKDSLRLLRNAEGNGDNGDTYYIDFVFDADVNCSITVHYLAFEDLSTGHAVYTTNDSALTSRVFHFNKGANQSFGSYGKFHLIKPSKFRESELIYSETTNHIPVVIHIAASGEGESPSERENLNFTDICPKKYSGHSNITIANIEKLPDETYTIKLLKQKQMVDGLCYLLHEIYGLESKEDGESGEDNHTDLSDEDYDEYEDENVVCVVCMSATRDTLMLPCKHLCVCSSCASSLRRGLNNCPICRVPFHALLQLCAYQRASTHLKSQDPYYGYEKVDLFDALNAFNVVKRRESSREIVRRVSARVKSRTGADTPKPTQATASNEKMPRRSSSRFSRSSRGSHRRDRDDACSDTAESVSKASLRSSSRRSRKGSGKSHVGELDESNCVVDVEPQVAAFDRVERVETGLEVGQDNLGVDALEEDAKREERPGPAEVHEIDETNPYPITSKMKGIGSGSSLPRSDRNPSHPSSDAPNVTAPVPTTSRHLVDAIPDTPNPCDLPLPSTSGNLVESISETPASCNVPLPGTPLDNDVTDHVGAEIEPSATGEKRVDLLIV